MDESRKQFEEWVKFHLDDKYSEVPLYKNKGGANYLDSKVDLAWIAWQASRAAIEIELPMKKAEHSYHQSAFNGGIDASAKAIRAAGIKVKE